MITFLTLQCNLIWGDVMQAVVLVPKHISVPTSSGGSAHHLSKGRTLTALETRFSLRSLNLSDAC